MFVVALEPHLFVIRVVARFAYWAPSNMYILRRICVKVVSLPYLRDVRKPPQTTNHSQDLANIAPATLITYKFLYLRKLNNARPAVTTHRPGANKHHLEIHIGSSSLLLHSNN